jgi:ADP-heptose:LPS heptosyltransferase
MTRRLLFVTSTRIGDAVLSTGLLDHLITEMEGPRVTVACGPLAAPLFAGVPGLEEVISMPKRRRGGHWWDLWRRIAGTRWDTVVDLRRSALVYLLPFARRRRVLGRVPDDRHRVEAIASVVGLADHPPPPRLWTLPRHEARADLLFGADGDPVLAIGPTANWRAKMWRAAHFAALVDRLTGPRGPLPGARIAVLGGPGEEAQARPVLEAVPPMRRLDLVGGEDLLTVFACLKRCALYVGNDSALMHMAAAAGIPTLGLFGPSREEHFGPWGARAAAVRTVASHAQLVPPGVDMRHADSLMDSLTVDMAEAAARRCLEAL